MLLTETASVVWNSRNKKHYIDLGYEFTKMGDSFSARVSDLTKGSQATVDVKCDYCGGIVKTYWYEYQKRKNTSVVGKDCCKNCCELKAAEAIECKYGGYKDFYTTTNAKRISTNIERFGCENVFSSRTVQEKIINTNLQKYGVPYSQQNDKVRSKSERTCLERYGVENYIEVFRGQFIGENSPCWKGGVEFHRVERYTHAYITWRSAVFSRDKYRCQCCSAKNGESYGNVTLHAHHIQNWKDNAELRYDISNGITFCKDCHMAFHSLYGKHNNTSAQIDEFINNNLDKKIC